MGSALVSAVWGKSEPTVGLLNIGEEAIKGSEAIKAAGELLRQAAAAGFINFHGNVEATDIFKGTTDIVVCDGFVGNVHAEDCRGTGLDADHLHQAGVPAHAALASSRRWLRCRC